MLYHIGYCPARDECFSMTHIDPSDIYLLEYFAVYDSFNDTLEYDFKYFICASCCDAMFCLSYSIVCRRLCC